MVKAMFLVVSMGALDREIKETIATSMDDAPSMRRIASTGSLKMAGGAFRIISSRFEDGGFLSMGGGKGLTKDTETRRIGGEKLT